MKKSSSIIWGLVLVVIGTLLILDITNLVNINVFFDGWWTLFIIVPCAISLITENEKTGNLIGLIIGILLLASCRDWIEFELVFKLIIPIILLVIGLNLIFKNMFNKVAKIDKKSFEGLQNYTATFSEVKENIEGNFDGADINAIFGGVRLDLSEAKFKNENYISVCSVFGGVTLIVPNDVVVKTGVTQIFAGTDDHRKNANKDGKKVLYVKGSSIFGGIDIR